MPIEQDLKIIEDAMRRIRKALAKAHLAERPRRVNPEAMAVVGEWFDRSYEIRPVDVAGSVRKADVYAHFVSDVAGGPRPGSRFWVVLFKARPELRERSYRMREGKSRCYALAGVVRRGE